MGLTKFRYATTTYSRMPKLRVLYVATEIAPFLKVSEAAEMLRQLPQSMQNRSMEIRIIVPRFSIINERKNRLHEVE